MLWKELENKILNILLDFEHDVYYNDNDSKLSELKNLIMKEFIIFFNESNNKGVGKYGY